MTSRRSGEGRQRVRARHLLLVLASIAASACAKPKPPGPPPPLFVEHRWPAGGRTPFAVAAADFNGDGRPDLAVSLVDGNVVALLLGTGDGGFAGGPVWPTSWSVSRGMVVSDLNHDGQQDLVVANVESNLALVFLADGHGGAVRKGSEAGLAPFNVAAADLDGDGNVDIVVANESNIPVLEGKGQVSVGFGDGHGDFPRHLLLEGGSYPADVKVVDINGDGHMDIVVVNWGSRDISLFLGRGDGTFAAPTFIPCGQAPAYTLAIADLNGDGRPDVVVGDLAGAVRVFYNDGGGGLTAAAPLQVGSGLRCVIIADLNGDGLPDLATANTSAGTVTVFFATAAGGFQPPYHIAVGRLPRVVTAADFNGDGKLDLAVTNGGSDDISVLINTGAAR